MKRHNDTILVLFLISILVRFPSQAQNHSSDSTSLKEGAWALQFGIAGNFTLTSFQGSTISVKYHLSDRNAIRGGITVNGNTNDGNTTNSGSIADTGYGSVPGSNATYSANVSFVVQYLWYMNPNGPIHIYAGIGPSVSYSYSHSSSDNYNLYNDNNHGYWVRYVSKSNSILWAPGVTGAVGVEWFAVQWLSIRAEYGETLQYQWRSSSSMQDNSSATYPNYVNNHSDNSGTSKGWGLSSSSVSFGLSVYW